MGKEKKVSKHDARLMKASLDLAKSYVEAELNPPDTRNTLATEKMHKDTHAGLFRALKNEVSVGSRDIRGLFTIAKKARALELRKRENE